MTSKIETGITRYEMIYQMLFQAIQNQQIPVGLVLLEGPLAELFGTSRVPVRKALELLNRDNLIERFDGRGFIVASREGEIKPIRLPLTREMLTPIEAEELVDMRTTGERILDNLQEAVSTCMVFGHYELNEGTAAEFYNTGRNIIRECLMRLRDKGIVEKEPYSQWFAGPLTAKSIREHFEVRISLEPVALGKAGPSIPKQVILENLDFLNKIENKAVSAAELEKIEDDLHVQCMQYNKNNLMNNIIKQSLSPQIVSRLFYSMLHLPIENEIILEHKLIYEMLLKENWELAAIGLREHIKNSQERTLQKLKVLSVLPVPELPRYLIKLS